MTSETSPTNLFVLTGAGVSAESGIATFRDENGLWAKHRIEDVATPEAFARDPARVQSFYDARRAALGTVEPNAAHRALARLQREHAGDVTLVTQNIDDLHERAGAEVVHMHGELAKARCVECDRVTAWTREIAPSDRCERCAAGLRPHVVWFGEMPLRMDEIGEALARSDLFVAIGTSGEVYPAAGFVAEARANGARTLEINLEPSGAAAFERTIAGPATVEVPCWVDEVLGAARGAPDTV